MRYGHYERFAYRYEYVHFTYSCMAMLHLGIVIRVRLLLSGEVCSSVEGLYMQVDVNLFLGEVLVY